MLLDEMKEELVQGLTAIFQNNIAMIILYGSVARNEAANEYLKTEILGRSLAAIIKESSLCRENQIMTIFMLRDMERQKNSLKMQHVLCR